MAWWTARNLKEFVVTWISLQLLKIKLDRLSKHVEALGWSMGRLMNMNLTISFTLWKTIVEHSRLKTHTMQLSRNCDEEILFKEKCILKHFSLVYLAEKRIKWLLTCFKKRKTKIGTLIKKGDQLPLFRIFQSFQLTLSIARPRARTSGLLITLKSLAEAPRAIHLEECLLTKWSLLVTKCLVRIPKKRCQLLNLRNSWVVIIQSKKITISI